MALLSSVMFIFHSISCISHWAIVISNSLSLLIIYPIVVITRPEITVRHELESLIEHLLGGST